MQELNIQNLVQAGAHFGHEVKRWNPRMKNFVYEERGGVHIIDLRKTLTCAKLAIKFLEKTTSEGGSVIFVGTKFQALACAKAAAEDSGQFYVNKRWLGGTLTNFETVKISIDRMKKMEKMRERGDLDRYSKKEVSRLEKEYKKMEECFRGIKDMKNLPSALFIVDIKKERIALNEARKLKIPIVAVVDTNCDPGLVNFPIPANDDSLRSIRFFTEMAGLACKKGREVWEKSLRKTQALSEKTEEIKSQNGHAPAVVQLKKKPKSRKLVAAGTAEEMEIKMELEREGDEKSSSLKTSERKTPPAASSPASSSASSPASSSKDNSHKDKS